MSICVILYDNNSKNKLIGFISLLLSNFLAISIPLFKNYYLWSPGDPLTHVANIRGVIYSNTISVYAYPALSSLSSVVINTSQVTPRSLTLFLPNIIYFLFAVGMYVLLRYYSDYEFSVAIGITIVLSTSFGINIFDPARLSYSLVPIIIFSLSLLNEFKKKEFAIITTLFLAALIPFHPLTAGITLLLFSLYMITYSYGSSVPQAVEAASIALIIGAVMELYWIQQFRRTVMIIVSFIGFFNESSSSDGANYASLIARASPDLTLIAQMLLLRFGGIVINGLGALSSVVLLLNARRKYDQNNIFIGLSFALILLLSIASLFIFFFSPFRFLSLIKIFSVVSITLFLDVIFSHNDIYGSYKTRCYIKNLMYLVVILVVVISLLSVYPSPQFTKQQNGQVTEQHVKSTEWIYRHNHNPGVINLDYLGPAAKRLDTYVHYGDNTGDVIKRIPPAHFGYENPTRPTYLQISQKGKNFYPSVYPEFRHLWNFYPKDFASLNNQASVNQIYSSGDVGIYRI